MSYFKSKVRYSQGQLLAFKALKRHIKYYTSVRIKGYQTSNSGMNEAP